MNLRNLEWQLEQPNLRGASRPGLKPRVYRAVLIVAALVARLKPCPDVKGVLTTRTL